MTDWLDLELDPEELVARPDCGMCGGEGLTMASDTGQARGPGYDAPDYLMDCPCITTRREVGQS